MNVLITGIHGFVGSNLVVALKERHGLYGLDIVTPEKDGVIKTFSWDDLDKEMPEFDAAYEELGEDIHFLMVNMTGKRMILKIGMPQILILRLIRD